MADDLTISAVAARTGLPETTLRYWEQIGLIPPVARSESSGHRRYRESDVALLETLANLRAVGFRLEDMRLYLQQSRDGDDAAAEQAALFQAHAERLAARLATLRERSRYLDLKVRYWTARATGDSTSATALAEEITSIIPHLNPKEPPE
jgi:DNA-binding transcriptional MerR regulator